MSDDPYSTLARKLRTLDLTPGEAAALQAVLVRAADQPDVEGFGMKVGSLGFEGLGLYPSRSFKGTDEELQFKGSDEELQVLVDWLGEPRRRG